MKVCVSCGEEIHPKRLEILPNTQQCVTCSTTGRKAGVTIVGGEGDHTFNDVIIMDREVFEEYQELEHKIYGRRKDDISHPEEEEVEVVEGDEDEEVIEIEEVEEVDPDDLED
jgi:hypothetical protein